MNSLQTTIQELKSDLNKLVAHLRLPEKREELEKLTTATTQPNFWNDSDTARTISQQRSSLEAELAHVATLQKKVDDLQELALLSEEDSNIESELDSEVRIITKSLSVLKVQSYLSGKYDEQEAILTIYSGQGGIEAMDWAAMLMRMYIRFFEIKEWSFELVEQSNGEEAGIKSATFLVKNRYAYGYLKGERGTHRLVRLSPFNADNLRQTSFAGVEVLPFFNDENQVPEIKDEDLEWQFFRSGGKGGQNVNKVSTAVRVKHIPSGVVVTASAERTQLQNRKIATQILEAKLWQIEEEKRSNTTADIKGEHKLAGWGNQIRSYVLHPYQLVKDNRTDVETSNAQAVLDGQLEDFINAEIMLAS